MKDVVARIRGLLGVEEGPVHSATELWGLMICLEDVVERIRGLLGVEEGPVHSATAMRVYDMSGERGGKDPWPARSRGVSGPQCHSTSDRESVGEKKHRAGLREQNRFGRYIS